MWELTSSHKSLRVLIRRQDAPGNLLISCLEPLAIKGQVRWLNCDLNVTTTRLAGTDELGFTLSDNSTGFEVICGALEVKENVNLGF